MRTPQNISLLTSVGVGYLEPLCCPHPVVECEEHSKRGRSGLSQEGLKGRHLSSGKGATCDGCPNRHLVSVDQVAQGAMSETETFQGWDIAKMNFVQRRWLREVCLSFLLVAGDEILVRRDKIDRGYDAYPGQREFASFQFLSIGILNPLSPRQLQVQGYPEYLYNKSK